MTRLLLLGSTFFGPFLSTAHRVWAKLPNSIPGGSNILDRRCHSQQYPNMSGQIPCHVNVVVCVFMLLGVGHKVRDKRSGLFSCLYFNPPADWVNVKLTWGYQSYTANCCVVYRFNSVALVDEPLYSFSSGSLYFTSSCPEGQSYYDLSLTAGVNVSSWPACMVGDYRCAVPVN